MPSRSSDLVEAPASHFQRLHLERSDRGRLTHNVQLRWLVRGPLDSGLVRDTLGGLAARHEVLRTSLEPTTGGALQVIGPPRDVPLTCVDLSGVDRRRRWRALSLQASEDVTRPFDLTVAPMFRACVVRLAGRAHVVVLTASHAAWDGWSSGIALQDFARLYEALRVRRPPRLPPVRLQFADHVAAVRAPSQSAIAHWRAALADYRPLVSLAPGERRVEPMLYEAGAFRFRAASATVLSRLRSAARDEGATVGIAVIAALLVLLWLASGSDRPFVAVNDANRDEPLYRSVIGPFLSFLMVGARLEPEATLATALRRTRRGVLAAYAHRCDIDAQLPDASRWSDPRWPVIHDAWMNFFPHVQPFASAAQPIDAADISIQPLDVHGASDARWNDGAFGLTVVESAAGALDATAVYNRTVVGDPRARSLASAYSRVLGTMALRPHRSLAHLRTDHADPV